MAKHLSPYELPNRLQDVIAAVTVLATAHDSEADIPGWTRVLSKIGDKDEGLAGECARWLAVFEDHPEFFIAYWLGGKRKAALRLRYSNRTIDRKTRVAPENPNELTPSQRANLTSHPLSEAVLNSLITTAIGLHAAVLARKADRRAWLQLIAPIAGVLGVIVGAVLTNYLSHPAAPTAQQIELKWAPPAAAQKNH